MQKTNIFDKKMLNELVKEFIKSNYKKETLLKEPTYLFPKPILEQDPDVDGEYDHERESEEIERGLDQVARAMTVDHPILSLPRDIADWFSETWDLAWDLSQTIKIGTKEMVAGGRMNLAINNVKVANNKYERIIKQFFALFPRFDLSSYHCTEEDAPGQRCEKRGNYTGYKVSDGYFSKVDQWMTQFEERCKTQDRIDAAVEGKEQELRKKTRDNIEAKGGRHNLEDDDLVRVSTGHTIVPIKAEDYWWLYDEWVKHVKDKWSWVHSDKDEVMMRYLIMPKEALIGSNLIRELVASATSSQCHPMLFLMFCQRFVFQSFFGKEFKNLFGNPQLKKIFELIKGDPDWDEFFPGSDEAVPTYNETEEYQPASSSGLVPEQSDAGVSPAGLDPPQADDIPGGPTARDASGANLRHEPGATFTRELKVSYQFAIDIALMTKFDYEKFLEEVKKETMYHAFTLKSGRVSFEDDFYHFSTLAEIDPNSDIMEWSDLKDCAEQWLKAAAPDQKTEAKKRYGLSNTFAAHMLVLYPENVGVGAATSWLSRAVWSLSSAARMAVAVEATGGAAASGNIWGAVLGVVAIGFLFWYDPLNRIDKSKVIESYNKMLSRLEAAVKKAKQDTPECNVKPGAYQWCTWSLSHEESKGILFDYIESMNEILEEVHQSMAITWKRKLEEASDDEHACELLKSRLQVLTGFDELLIGAREAMGGVSRANVKFTIDSTNYESFRKHIEKGHASSLEIFKQVKTPDVLLTPGMNENITPRLNNLEIDEGYFDIFKSYFKENKKLIKEQTTATHHNKKGLRTYENIVDELFLAEDAEAFWRRSRPKVDAANLAKKIKADLKILNLSDSVVKVNDSGTAESKGNEFINSVNEGILKGFAENLVQKSKQYKHFIVNEAILKAQGNAWAKEMLKIDRGDGWYTKHEQFYSYDNTFMKDVLALEGTMARGWLLADHPGKSTGGKYRIVAAPAPFGLDGRINKSNCWGGFIRDVPRGSEYVTNSKILSSLGLGELNQRDFNSAYSNGSNGQGFFSEKRVFRAHPVADPTTAVSTSIYSQVLKNIEDSAPVFTWAGARGVGWIAPQVRSALNALGPASATQVFGSNGSTEDLRLLKSFFIFYQNLNWYALRFIQKYTLLAREKRDEVNGLSITNNVSKVRGIILKELRKNPKLKATRSRPPKIYWPSSTWHGAAWDSVFANGANERELEEGKKTIRNIRKKIEAATQADRNNKVQVMVPFLEAIQGLIRFDQVLGQSLITQHQSGGPFNLNTGGGGNEQ